MCNLDVNSRSLLQVTQLTMITPENQVPCSSREVGGVSLKNKTAGYLTSRMSLFGNVRGVAAWDELTMANP